MFECTEADFRYHQDNYNGLCTECGEWSDGGCEPDAEKYECEYCGCHAVCGAEQALIIGALGFCEDDEAMNDDNPLEEDF